jgi:Aspartyl protease
VSDCHISALLDSGATGSFINYKLLQSLKIHSQPCEQIKVQVADKNSSMTINETAEIWLKPLTSIFQRVMRSMFNDLENTPYVDDLHLGT